MIDECEIAFRKWAGMGFNDGIELGANIHAQWLAWQSAWEAKPQPSRLVATLNTCPRCMEQTNQAKEIALASMQEMHEAMKPKPSADLVEKIEALKERVYYVDGKANLSPYADIINAKLDAVIAALEEKP